MKKYLLFLIVFTCFFNSLQAKSEEDSTTMLKSKNRFRFQNNKIINDTLPKIPFQGDFTWLNGNNRQSGPLLTSKYVTLGLLLDVYYNYSFNEPKDNTIQTTSIIGRHNEISLNFASVALEVNYENVYARVQLQMGSMLSTIQETDPTVNRGRNLRVNDLKYIREATIGYKFNKWYGINFETGIFMSYIGLESYVPFENWSYQRAFVCDFTPFYFTGARLQIHPSKNLKIEPWIMNGWYTYGKYNQQFGMGLQVNYRPQEWISLVSNNYYGPDQRNNPTRKRFHTDNSVLVRYMNRPTSKGISRIASSFTVDYGNESGGDNNASLGTSYADPNDIYFFGFSCANRIWFAQNKYGLTLRAGYVSNPGRYLPVNPSSVGFLVDPSNPSDASFEVKEFTSTFDYMPNQYITFRTELVVRNSSVPYFAGPGGTTSPDGWQVSPIQGVNTPDFTFVPDLVKDETRLIFAVNLRF